MKLVQWKQIDPDLKQHGSLTGSLYLTGSFFLNNIDIVQQIVQSGIFQQTGSFWSTTNNLLITGSFKIKLPENQVFEISTQEEERLKVNEEGVLVLAPFLNTPTPISGGFIYSGSNEFFLGL